jgi:Uma2 family endonuclease
MVISGNAAFLPSPTVTPFICIEILSPDDRVAGLQEKIDDYAAMGVQGIWIVDPPRRAMTIADASGSRKVQEFTVPGTEERITSQQLFAELDELERRTV